MATREQRAVAAAARTTILARATGIDARVTSGEVIGVVYLRHPEGHGQAPQDLYASTTELTGSARVHDGASTNSMLWELKFMSAR